MNLHDLFAIPCLRTPEKTAIQVLDRPVTPQTLSYADLFAAADQLAAGLQQWGLQKGDRVAFFIGSRPELVVAYLAVIRLGGVVVPINLRYRRLEIGHILADCTPALNWLYPKGISGQHALMPCKRRDGSAMNFERFARRRRSSTSTRYPAVVSGGHKAAEISRCHSIPDLEAGAEQS